MTLKSHIGNSYAGRRIPAGPAVVTECGAPSSSLLSVCKKSLTAAAFVINASKPFGRNGNDEILPVVVDGLTASDTPGMANIAGMLLQGRDVEFRPRDLMSLINKTDQSQAVIEYLKKGHNFAELDKDRAKLRRLVRRRRRQIRKLGYQPRADRRKLSRLVSRIEKLKQRVGFSEQLTETQLLNRVLGVTIPDASIAKFVVTRAELALGAHNYSFPVGTPIVILNAANYSALEKFEATMGVIIVVNNVRYFVRPDMTVEVPAEKVKIANQAIFFDDAAEIQLDEDTAREIIDRVKKLSNFKVMMKMMLEDGGKAAGKEGLPMDLLMQQFSLQMLAKNDPVQAVMYIMRHPDFASVAQKVVSDIAHDRETDNGSVMTAEMMGKAKANLLNSKQMIDTITMMRQMGKANPIFGGKPKDSFFALYVAGSLANLTCFAMQDQVALGQNLFTMTRNTINSVANNTVLTRCCIGSLKTHTVKDDFPVLVITKNKEEAQEVARALEGDIDPRTENDALANGPRMQTAAILASSGSGPVQTIAC